LKNIEIMEVNMENIQQKVEEMDLDLREIFNIIKKRKKMIAFITLLATLASGIFSFFLITPIYDASTEILVNKSENEQGSVYNINDINTDLKLISTYSVIIKSPRIIDIVIEEFDLDINQEELVNKIKVNTVKDSQVMKITVEDPDQQEAARMANAIAAVFKREIVNIMNVDNVQILTEAKNEIDPTPVKPNTTLNIAIAFVLGLMLSVGLSFLLEYLDNTIKTEEEVERLLGYPVLGIIATIEDKLVSKKSITKSSALVQRGEVNEA